MTLTKLYKQVSPHHLEAFKIQAQELKPLMDEFLKDGWTIISGVRAEEHYQIHAVFGDFTIQIGKRWQYPEYNADTMFDTDLHKNRKLYDALWHDETDIFNHKIKFNSLKNPKAVFNRIMKEIYTKECREIIKNTHIRLQAQGDLTFKRETVLKDITKQFKGTISHHKEDGAYFDGIDIKVNHKADKIVFTDLKVSIELAEKIIELVQAEAVK